MRASSVSSNGYGEETDEEAEEKSGFFLRGIPVFYTTVSSPRVRPCFPDAESTLHAATYIGQLAAEL
jgi:hypothetical protein